MKHIEKTSPYFKVQGVLFLFFVVIGCLGAEEEDRSALLKKDFRKQTGISTQQSGLLRNGALTTFDGNALYIEDIKGSFTLLSFGATWCPPCREEFPSLQRLHEHFEAQGLFNILTVFVGEDPDVVQEYLEQFHLEFPGVLDLQGAVAQQNNVRSIPTSYLIDPEGNIIARHIGSLEWDRQNIIDAIDSLILQWQES